MKKYYIERYRDEYEDYIAIGLTPTDEKEYLSLKEQDGLNWYCHKDEFDFVLLNSLEEVIDYDYLKLWHGIQDLRIQGLPEEDKKYILNKLERAL